MCLFISILGVYWLSSWLLGKLAALLLLLSNPTGSTNLPKNTRLGLLSDGALWSSKKEKSSSPIQKKQQTERKLPTKQRWQRVNLSLQPARSFF